MASASVIACAMFVFNWQRSGLCLFAHIFGAIKIFRTIVLLTTVVRRMSFQLFISLCAIHLAHKLALVAMFCRLVGMGSLVTGRVLFAFYAVRLFLRRLLILG